MWFWWMMFFFNLLVPVIMISAGRMMAKHCPQEINPTFGYRTKGSMKNMDTWKFAHKYCGELWWKIGWILFAAAILIQIPFYHGSKDTVSYLSLGIMGVELVVLLLSIVPTEQALKRNFDENGNPR